MPLGVMASLATNGRAVHIGALDPHLDDLGEKPLEIGVVGELEHPPCGHRRDRLTILKENGLLEVLAEDELERYVDAPGK